MNYAEIKRYDIANGVGVRTSLFVSGCRHRCKGCFNAKAWDFGVGEPFTYETEDEILRSLEPAYVAGLSVLGGEPMEPENQDALAPFLERVRARYPNKTIWMWTGFTWEELTQQITRADTDKKWRVLNCLDVLVDGRFVEAQKDITLRFRGSENQRVLDVQRSLDADKPVEWHDDVIFATHGWTS